MDLYTLMFSFIFNFSLILFLPPPCAVLDDDLKAVMFDVTPKMSTYLLAFAVGEFGRTLSLDP
jgi:hypothetical protein